MAVATFAFAVAANASSPRTLIESEPNDTPQSAASMSAPATLIGSMRGGDQDGWLWTVTDEDASRRWHLELAGIPGILTLVELARLEYSSTGEATSVDRLLKLSSRDGKRPVMAEELIFEPGEYLLGIARSGAEAPFRPVADTISFDPEGASKGVASAAENTSTAYRLFVTEGESLPSSDGSQPWSKETAMEIEPEREKAVLIESSTSAWYAISFAGEQAGARWQIGAQVPVGRSVATTLYDAAGEKLAEQRSDTSGKLALEDISLPAGDYFVEVSPTGRTDSSRFMQTILLTETGQPVAGSEAEPNDQWRVANHTDDPACCSGRLADRDDVDVYRYEFGEADVQMLKSLTLTSESDDTLQLCLLDARGGTVQCREGRGNAVMNDLLLTPGVYGVKVSGRRSETAYRLDFVDSGPIEPGMESEPNDRLAYAIGTPQNNRIKGSFDQRDDVDFYRFVIDDEPQLWRILAIGENISKIEYHDAVGGLNQRINAARNQRRISLENLFLLPGTHHISVTGGASGDYTLLARALGPPDPNGELEPNDDVSRMQTLHFGQERTGLLNNPGDVDRYKFHLANWTPIHLTVAPPADGKLAAELHHDGMRFGQAKRIDGDIVLTGLFPPGDYRLSLEPRETSDAEYRLSLERGERYRCDDDCEPNNDPVFANPFPRGRVLTGRSGDWGDRDWYQLPGFAEAQEVAFVMEGTHDFRVYDAELEQLDFGLDREANAFRGTLPPGERYLLRVGKGIVPDEYTVTMLIGAESAPPTPSEDLPAELDLELSAAAVTPYESFGQRVTGTLTVRNLGPVPLALDVEASVSDARWHTELAASTLTVDPGGAPSIAMDITASPDVWGVDPVRVSVRAADAAGRAVTAGADLRVDAAGLPADPVHAWHVPPALRGGINAARVAFGAVPTAQPMPGNHPEESLAQLFDGRAAFGTGPSFRGGRDRPQQITVDLAGDRPVPVAGFAVNPLYKNFKQNTPRDVEFQLSADGSSFDTVMKGKLTTVARDQHFVLEEPVPATHARLLLSTNWQGKTDGPLTLGEWKVIAQDGFDPRGEDHRNIATPNLGGHVVWSQPPMRGRDSSLLTPESEKLAVRLPKEGALEWVIGFHHERVAKVVHIGWNDTEASGEDIDQLTLSASVESPVGPWEPFATWSPADSPQGMILSEPVWARYLKFSVESDDESPWVNLPETITVREAATRDDYRSILGEWGVDSRSAFYESLQPLPLRDELARRANVSRESAAALAPGQPEAGQVQLLEQTHWYRPQVPPGHNTLVLTLTGQPTVRTDLHLTTTSGEVVPLKRVDNDSGPDRLTYEVFVGAEASDLLLEVSEPPRSVMFMWDTSPSIGQYRPMIYRSVRAYAEDLRPGVDTANLLPFGASRPLLDDWYGEPYLMQLILNDHSREEGSSAAELANATATRALAARPGTKAIVTITDAQTPRHPQMWNGMKQVQPRVFSMHVGPQPDSQDLMQSWSSVNGGHYAYVTDENEMEIAFERAATMLRRPAQYELTLETEQREPPGPGYLSVVSGDEAPGRGAVELILDASGSMLQRLEGRRRIDIAKEVLTTAMRDHIPAGTPTALRVFGHQTPNACETDLVMPLEPLVVESAISRLAGIEAKNLARTPIANSLAAVARDLDGASGQALIVLVTDGEETCDGDPLAVIESLRDSGMSVSLNIVGFAIDDPALSDQFASWAEAGGGRYLGASDSAQLDDAISNALSPTFSVFDTQGSKVASGIVDGEPLELEQGIYRVVFGESQETEDVEISADARIELTK